VFVESEHDEALYERLYAKLRPSLVPEVSLAFISSGIAGSGNCDAVCAVVGQLRGSGNRFVWGIVDWDCKPHAVREGITVLGLERRYSIENYLLDPAIVAAFLLREKVLTKDEVGIEFRELLASTWPPFQSTVDLIVARVRSNLKDVTDAVLETSRFHNGMSVQVPRWYLRMRGHDLEAAVVKAFPYLEKFGPEDFKLKREIVKTVLDDIPGLISDDLVSLFLEIQRAR
jgi:hypothetical protein